MPKTYVLDTNVVLCDPDAIFKFEDSTVILPITVVEEVDKFKKEQSELGRNARQLARNLDELREKGRLDEGVETPEGGVVKTALTLSRTLLRLPFDLDGNVADNRILSVAIDSSAILVSNDINLRIKADAVGVRAESYRNNVVQFDSFYRGTGDCIVEPEFLDSFFTDKVLSIDYVEFVEPPIHNQYFTVYDKYNSKRTALARYDSTNTELKLLPGELKLMGIVPKTKEQQFSLDALLDPSIPLVTLTGPAGTAKTFSALLAGLYQVLETKQYSKVMIIKPIVAMDNSNQLGFRKGYFLDKMAPWISSFSDNISVIMGGGSSVDSKGKSKSKKKCTYEDKESAGTVSMLEELMAYGLIEVGDLETMRGRSLPDMFIILDEAQSSSQHLLKSVITRLAEGSKIICAGDLSQIDLPWVSAETSGLTHVIEKFKGDKLAAHIHFTKSVRSVLAERAAELL